jgi:hypothetical protein
VNGNRHPELKFSSFFIEKQLVCIISALVAEKARLIDKTLLKTKEAALASLFCHNHTDGHPVTHHFISIAKHGRCICADGPENP